MVDGYSLREMREEDWDAFNNLHSFEGDITEQGFQNRVVKGGFFGLFLSDVLVGYMNLNLFGDDEGHFQGIFIGEEYRGRGLSNILMEHSFTWYRERDVKKIHLYTEVDNEIAKGLYRKHGFSIDSRAWHFIVPFSTVEPTKKYTCQDILEEEIDLVGNLSERLPAGEIRRWFGRNDRRILAMKDNEEKLVGICLFTPSFPGCRPFEIKSPDCFDDCIIGIKERSLPQFDYVRITFSGNADVAGLCKERKYKLVHEMFYFTKKLSP